LVGAGGGTGVALGRDDLPGSRASPSGERSGGANGEYGTIPFVVLYGSPKYPTR
jgi:hypothetical protein